MSAPGTFKKISTQDTSINPFKAYKSWGYATTSSLSADGIDRLVAVKPNPNKYSGGDITLDSFQTILDTGSLIVNLANDKETGMIWYSLNHLYYKPYNQFYNDSMQRALYKEAVVLSVPETVFGEQIKPRTVHIKLQNSSITTSSYADIIDDGNGNLILTDSYGNAVTNVISNEILFLGFDQTTYNNDWIDSDTTSIYNSNVRDHDYDRAISPLQIKRKNVRFSNANNDLPDNSLAAFFNQNGYLRIYNDKAVNFKNSDDFTLAFNLYLNFYDILDTTKQYIVSKRTTELKNTLNKGIIETKDFNSNYTQYPFDIYFQSGYLYAKQSSGGSTVTLQSIILAPFQTYHIAFQKSGSSVSLYVNGGLISTKNGIPASENINNLADIFIGSLGIDLNTLDGNNGLNGSIDNFFIFNKGLTQTEIQQLAKKRTDYGDSLMSTINTNVVGNVFYNDGIIVLSEPFGTVIGDVSLNTNIFNDVIYNRQTGNVLDPMLSDIYTSFNSTVTLYEHEYIIKLKEDEFNFTTNPTIRKNNDLNADLPKAFVANTEFSPYITTIGLYDEYGQLLAIAKLGTPIKKRDNVDTTFVVRFDI